VPEDSADWKGGNRQYRGARIETPSHRYKLVEKCTGSVQPKPRLNELVQKCTGIVHAQHTQPKPRLYELVENDEHIGEGKWQVEGADVSDTTAHSHMHL
jgi:hypothetical protein